MTPLTPEQSQMVEENMGLAYHMAGKLTPKSPIDHDEIVSICLLALVKAALSYDPTKGFAFTTYAANKMQWDTYKETHPKKPKLESMYLDDILSEDGQSHWQDFIPGKSPENEIVCEIATEQIKDYVYANLKPSHRGIFLAHYQNPELTQKEVGELTGHKQGAVCRIYKKLLKQRMNVAI